MNQDERRLYIKRKLEISKKVEIDELSKELDVSEMTIRRDFEYLEKKRVLNRVSKGAILNLIRDRDIVDDTLKTRSLQNIKEKKAIAQYASNLIEDEDVIFLDASTTVYGICEYIVNKTLTIITNSIRVAQYFNTAQNITVILTGGILRYATLSLIGSDSEESLKKYNTNKLFISAKALSYENGLTDVNMFEINTKKVAMENTSNIIVLLDHTKINKTSLKKVCDIKNISKIIIDGFHEFSKEEEEVLELIKKENVQIIITK